MFRGARPAAVLLATAILGTSPAAAADKPWGEKYYNPKPATDDLILPMPCGGAMVFRPVAVPTDGWLGDHEVVLGGNDDRFSLSESARFDYVAGSFPDADDPDRRLYYMGKYEVSELQYGVFGDKCVKPNDRDRLPAKGVSWIDAVSFADRYTRWLIAEARDALPGDEEGPGFVRVPLEAEWEFAARGGLAVPGNQFQAAVFPMEEDVVRYVWYQGTKSANGKAQLTGLLRPNPLGLHDMLGNVDEVVLEPFRANKHSRLHGQAGGFVVKGGNFLTSREDIRSSYRQEIPHYDHKGVRRPATVGFRVMISAPVIVSRERLEALRVAWRNLPKTPQRGITGGDGRAVADPVEELEALRETLTDEEQRTRLARLDLILRSSVAENKQQRDRAARSMLRLGAFLGRKIEDDDRRLAGIRRLLAGRQVAQSSAERIQRLQSSVSAAEAAMDDNVDYFKDTVIQVAQDYPATVTDAQLARLLSEFRSQSADGLVPFAERFGKCLAEFRATKSFAPAICLTTGTTH